MLLVLVGVVVVVVLVVLLLLLLLLLTLPRLCPDLRLRLSHLANSSTGCLHPSPQSSPLTRVPARPAAGACEPRVRPDGPDLRVRPLRPVHHAGASTQGTADRDDALR